MGSLAATMKWFEQLAVARWSYTYSVGLDLDALRANPNYGRKLFVQYACTRQGAPHALEVSGIKAIAECERRGDPPQRIPVHFRNFYHGKLRASHNPLLDKRFAALDIPQIVDLVEQGNLREAFSMSKVSGVDHKIRSLFLRDLAVELEAETAESWTVEDQYLFCQPIDEWADAVASVLPESQAGNAGLRAIRYSLSRDQLGKAVKVIRHSLDSNASPLRVSQGMWFFARNVVADKARLQELVSSLDTQALQAEIDLMAGFLPGVAPAES